MRSTPSFVPYERDCLWPQQFDDRYSDQLDVSDRAWDRLVTASRQSLTRATISEKKNMDTNTLGDGLGARRRRRRTRRLGGGMPTLVGRRRRTGGKRRGRKICIRTSSGKKACGVRWRKRSRK